MNRAITRLIHSIFLTAALLAAGGALAQNAQIPQREVLDRMVAIVDEGVVLQSELESRLQQARQRAQQAEQQLPPEDVLREQVMESLIVENLQLQMAERAGIRIDDDTLNRVMSDLAGQNNMSFDQYVNALQQAGAYQQTREQIRRELAINEVQRGMVNRRINITQQEIENYLASEQARTEMAPDYMVDQLLVPVAGADGNGQVEAKREYARQLAERLNSGAEFATVQRDARQNSRGYQISGGELGWRKQEELPSLFAEIVPDMQIGEAHEPVRSGNGFHVLFLRDVRGDSNRLVDQTQVRHILIRPSEIRTETQAERLARDVHQQIEDGEDFSVLARQYSDDEMTVVGGGDMGWVSAGSMPPGFEEHINQLEVGEMSEPFQTQAGWHIAEVMGRRQEDLSDEYRRRVAENALRQRKFDIELENWLVELRDEAYVRIL